MTAESDLTFECNCGTEGEDSVAATVAVSSDALTIKRSGKEDLTLAARQVERLETGDTDIRLAVASRSIRLSKFGRRFDRASEAIGSWYKRGKLSDSVIFEKHIESFDEIEYDLARRGKRTGTFRLYSTHASVTDARSGRSKRLPYSYIRDILDEGLSVNIRMLKGPDVSLSMLGRRKDHLLRRFPELMGQLSKDLGEAGARILGLESQVDAKALASILPDGRASAWEQVRGKSQAVADAIIRFVEGSRLAPLYRSAEDLAFGMKKGLMGELDGDYLWMLARIGKAVVMDSASEREESSRAAYLFKYEANGFSGFIDELSWCLSNIGFRREPIYLSDEKLKEPGNESYLQALQDVPELSKVRAIYKGRVAHTDDGAWVDRVIAEAGCI